LPPNELPALASRAITFGSFNALSKLSPATIELWSAILRAIPDARLMLKSAALGDETTRDRVTAAFNAQDIGPTRLILRGRDQTLESHLQAYHEVDIALDTFPYHGTTTTCEALWMGVPVI